jgi:mRNA interferase MazF
MVSRFEIYLVNLDPEVTKNPKNTRPCVIVSPDEMNRNLAHVIVAPISSASNGFPTRLAVDLLGAKRAVILDQVRTVDSVRLVKKIGVIDAANQKVLLERLQEMFAD